MFLKSFSLGSFWLRGLKNHLLEREGGKFLEIRGSPRTTGWQRWLSVQCLPPTHSPLILSGLPLFLLSLAHCLLCSLLSHLLLLHFPYSISFPLPHSFCLLIISVCPSLLWSLLIWTLLHLFSCRSYFPIYFLVQVPDSRVSADLFVSCQNFLCFLEPEAMHRTGFI